LEVPQLTSEFGATAADATRRTFGRCATAGAAFGWCPSRIRSESASKRRIRAAETRKLHSEEARSGAAGGGAE
jgi:hypothetical protein